MGLSRGRVYLVGVSRTIVDAHSAVGLPSLVFFATVVIGGALVLLYWGLWWKRQRGYFKATLQNNTHDRQ